MNHDWEIRVKEPRDAAAAARLLAESFGEKFNTLAAGNRDKALSIAEDEMKWRGRHDNFFVALRENNVIGIIEIISPDTPGVPSGEMLSIYFRRLGLGKGLRSAYLLSLFSRAVEDDEACVSNLAVAAEARRRGAAKSLLLHGEEFARDTGKKRLVLWVSVSNDAAVRLYESAGFETAGVSKSLQLKRFFGLESWVKMVKKIEPHA